ncbi:LLM class flavin-dependent oxidoreductase [Amycolatopsis sp. DSM 110486]|uniref:LLM class flavin-dependent oxidoreductase n=1 Tax=Amycolatopsis sp. DSM 110486 TaxID=2865832 RepID=UPI001C6A44CE|nr:LLM class flavin-dependent oxidoreductase [Amycolatopsis sp. DSM 110486]QYN17774.1 LLM class flavin-dependent oxidoreductase [Amycolatopsis sp. DSM 110486]
MSSLRFGAFMSPLHPVGEDPTLLLQRDLEIVQRLDELNYDEVWIGEHHSSGWGSISSPEVVLAAAAERTRRIRVATGVTALPYHHPFMVAERAVQLDHLTRGRFMLGVGAGSVIGDMHMMGVAPADTRRRTEQSLEVIVRLLRGHVVTHSTDWFALADGRLQLQPFTPGGFEIAVASAASPFGMRLAGRLGVSALSHAAPPWGAMRAGHGIGVEKLAGQWQHLAEAADAAGHEASRSRWRLAVPVHVAHSRDEAVEQVYGGWLRQRVELWTETMGMPMGRGDAAARKAFESTVDAGGIILGDVDDCVAGVQKLQEASGGFGTLLLSIQHWARHEHTVESLDLFARHVAPRFTGSAEGLRASQSWAAASKAIFQRENHEARTQVTSGQETAR